MKFLKSLKASSPASKTLSISRNETFSASQVADRRQGLEEEDSTILSRTLCENAC